MPTDSRDHIGKTHSSLAQSNNTGSKKGKKYSAIDIPVTDRRSNVFVCVVFTKE